MRTIMTKTQQADWIENNSCTLKHKWSTRGYGNSRILNGLDEQIGKAGGCGYDRYGAALGEAITTLFGPQLYQLAKRHCVGSRRSYKQPKNSRLYGLFYDAVKNCAWVDGGCGSRQMENILNAIGFGLDYMGEDSGSCTGVQFYQIRPVSKRELQWLKD